MVYYRLRANIISSIVSVEGIAFFPPGVQQNVMSVQDLTPFVACLPKGTAEKGLVNVVLQKTDTQLKKLLPEHRKFLQGNPFVNQLG